MKNLVWFDKLEEDPLWDFGADITLKYLGDDMVLLLGLSNDRAEQMNQEAMEGEESMFYSMEKWSPKLRAGQRLTWVQCWGVPLIASEKKYIQQIVAAMGDVADVDDDVEESRRVDRTRVLIRTPWSPAIQHTVYVNIGGGVEYKVHVVEEIHRGTESCTCRRRRDIWSSEEIDSDDSCFGTPLAASSVKSPDDGDNRQCPMIRNTADSSP